MRMLFLLTAILIILLGLRLIGVAIRTAWRGQVLTRRGLQMAWQPTTSRTDALKIAGRDGLMGLLLVVLGLVIIF